MTTLKVKRRPIKTGHIKKRTQATGRQPVNVPASTPEDLTFKLNIAPKVAEALERIGRPDEAIFQPDPFQIKAIELISHQDVIVSAPTGSGKTWIAEQAMHHELQKGGRAWYASPLKALSNAKYLEFKSKFGEDKVGLLTGDHKINTDAAIIIGTTEILRNQLYDAMSYGHDLPTGLVILDEAHYLGDKDRGVVWEEVLIYLPARVRLLLLSATIDNAGQLAAWLNRNRGCGCAVVPGGERPVPLMGLSLNAAGRLDALSLKASFKAPSRRFGARNLFSPTISLSKVMHILRETNLLPAIFFLKSRADCDLALNRMQTPSDEAPERFQARQQLVDEFLDKYPFLRDHPHLYRIRFKATAAHHAGHLPHYKLLVEELMSRGLLDAIFATSTVSAGVNFPARTVVTSQSDRFDGQGFSDLSATEFTQMTGRAGRRGRDHIGFALMLSGPHMNLGLMAALFRAAPDPVKSRLNINFSMSLNLLNGQRPSDIQKLLTRSLAVYQWASVTNKPPTEDSLKDAADDLHCSFWHHLGFLKQEGLADHLGNLTDDGLWATELRLDHPLVFYAGIKEDAWPLDPALLAAAIAALVADKESNKPPPRRKPPKKLVQTITNLIMAVTPMLERLEDDGFETPSFNLRPAWAIWSWATNGDFDEAVELLGLGGGDLAMLALRTADHLRQISNLKSHENLTRAAKEGIYKIIKEPVSSPL